MSGAPVDGRLSETASMGAGAVPVAVGRVVTAFVASAGCVVATVCGGVGQIILETSIQP